MLKGFRSLEPDTSVTRTYSRLQQVESEIHGLPIFIEEMVTGMRLVLIPAGEFLMNLCPLYDDKPSDTTKSQQLVRVKPFYLGVTPVTQTQYRTVTRKWWDHSNPSLDDRPVNEIQTGAIDYFVKKLQKNSGANLRLPTEIEWEYACRAGTKTKYYWGDQMNEEYCWCKSNSERKLQCVGRKLPNQWGLFDMSGNVEEICSDIVEDKKNVDEYLNHICRGGSFFNSPNACGSGYRSVCDDENWTVGFRLAADLPLR